MHLGLLKTIYMTTCFLTAFLFLIQKIFMKKLVKTEYVVVLAFFVAICIIEAVLVAVFLNNYLYKIIILLLAFSPFIIGKFAVYKTENIFSFVQILCFVASGILIYLI